MEKDDLLALVADVVSAYVGNNTVSASDLPGLINQTHTAFTSLGASEVVEAVAQEPAVPIKSSVKPDYIVCLEDGKKLKMLKRYIMSNFNMTPAEYRTKWGLKSDYPMVAPNYAATRKALALKSGLGRKPDAAAASPAKAAPKARGGKAAPKAAKASGGTSKAPRKSAKAALAASREILGD